MKVLDILRNKGNSIISVTPQMKVIEVLKVMAEKNVGGVLVMDNDKMLGIFTERDYARKISLKGKSAAESIVGDVMVKNLHTISPENDVADCMRMMTDKQIRHLPVMDKGTLVGLISIGDVVKSVIDEQQQVIEHLESYISR